MSSIPFYTTDEGDVYVDNMNTCIPQIGGSYQQQIAQSLDFTIEQQNPFHPDIWYIKQPNTPWNPSIMYRTKNVL